MFPRSEQLARTALVVILIALPALVLGHQFVLRPALSPIRVIDVIAAAPEQGGFQPDSIRVQRGETVLLRFHAADVVHGIAIGPGLGVDLGAVDPGRVEEITLTLDEAGTFSFYCTTWCSPNHWRMRGLISAYDHDGSIPPSPRDPVIDRLSEEGVDIDAGMHDDHEGHPRRVNIPQPSARRGAAFVPALTIPDELRNLIWRQRHTPAQAVEMLAAANPDMDEQTPVDVVAYLWLEAVQVADETIYRYEQNCAACHGQFGGGDGPIAASTASELVVFSDPGYMFTMRGDVLYAKIRRGGMGTDMPNFGTLFTSEETWALVDYLWTLSLDGENR
jgi:mono/diheme cytochrome c family protein/plastocyanin